MPGQRRVFLFLARHLSAVRCAVAYQCEFLRIVGFRHGPHTRAYRMSRSGRIAQLGVGSRAVPPSLPGGRMVRLGERGETFVRELADPAGSLPVVLLHGWMLTADANFVDVYEPLSRWHRVIAPDVRMHGRGSRTGGFTLTDAGDDVI